MSNNRNDASLAHEYRAGTATTLLNGIWGHWSTMTIRDDDAHAALQFDSDVTIDLHNYRHAAVIGPTGVHAMCGDASDARSAADARLFAAAPRMRAALRAALALLQDPDADNFDADRVEKVIESALAASEYPATSSAGAAA